MIGTLIANHIKRDDQLASSLGVDARHFRHDLQAWIQEELTELIQAFGIRLETEPNGPLKDAVQQTVDRLRQINLRELPAAVQKSEKSIADVADGGADNVYHGYELLLQGLSDLIRIGRDLLDIREQLINIAEQ